MFSLKIFFLSMIFHFSLYIILISKVLSQKIQDNLINLNDELKDLDIDIFISAPKDFNTNLEEPVFKIITDNKGSLKKKYNLNIIYSNERNSLYNKSSYYGDISRMNYIYYNYELKSYVGFVGYEYYNQFLSNIPNINDSLRKHDAILAKHKGPGRITLYRKYYYEHFGPNLDKLIEIVSEFYPEYIDGVEELKKTYDGYFPNLFIMKKKDFKIYINFLKFVFNKFDEIYGIRNQKDVRKYIKNLRRTYKFDKNSIQHGNIDYQQKMHFYLFEHLSYIFFKHHFKNPYLVDYIQTNEKPFYNSTTYIKNLDNLDIFIASYTKFKNNRTNLVYKILADDKISVNLPYSLPVIYTNENNSLYPKRRGYGETSKMYYIYKNYKNVKKYIGFVHQGRDFNFFNDIPDMDKIFEKYDIVLPKKQNFSLDTVYNTHTLHHYKEHLDTALKIINDNYPDYKDIIEKYKKIRTAYYKNSFIMKKEDFYKYCDFLYDVLGKFDDYYDFKTDEDTLKHIEILRKKNISEKWGVNLHTSMWQSRLQGFIAEGLSHIYFEKNFKNPYIVKIVETWPNLHYEFTEYLRDIKVMDIYTINRVNKYKYFKYGYKILFPLTLGLIVLLIILALFPKIGSLKGLINYVLPDKTIISNDGTKKYIFSNVTKL